MASYKIVFKRSVEKDFRSIPKETIERLLERISLLKEEPLPRNALKLTASNFLYRLRVGDCRIVYRIDKDKNQIIIQYVRHRRDAYNDI